MGSGLNEGNLGLSKQFGGPPGPDSLCLSSKGWGCTEGESLVVAPKLPDQNRDSSGFPG